MSEKKTYKLDGLNRLADLTSLDRVAQEHQIILLTVDQIEVKPQVRKDFKEIEELAQNFQVEGQQSPIIVGPIDPDTQKYPLQKGGRRVAAATLIPGFKVKAIVDATVRKRSSAIISQLNENEQRQNLNPYEIALALAEAKAESIKEGAPLSNQDLAKMASKSETYISIHLGLAELPDELIALIKDEITTDTEVLREMKQLRNLQPETYNAFIARANEERSISRQQVRDAVRLAKGKPVGGKGKGPTETESEQAGQAGQGGTATPQHYGTHQQEHGQSTTVSHAKPAGKEGQHNGNGQPVPQTPQTQAENGVQSAPPASQATKKANGKGFISIPADRQVIGIRVAMEDNYINGYLANDRVAEDPSKAWAVLMVGGNQQHKLVRVDQIELVSVAAMADGN
ncbi:TPA: ParB/RepB/Spo0J family partition protein [Pseudomonas aeruginosa]